MAGIWYCLLFVVCIRALACLLDFQVKYAIISILLTINHANYIAYRYTHLITCVARAINVRVVIV